MPKIIQTLINEIKRTEKEAEIIAQHKRELESKQILKDNQLDNNKSH